MKKTYLIQIKTIFTRDYFLLWKNLEQKTLKIFNFCYFNKFIISFFSRGAVFLMRYGYFKQGSNNILKQFLYFFTKNLWGTVKINFKSLYKIKLVF